MKVLHLLQSNRFSGAENVVCQIIGMMKNEPDIEMIYCSPDGPIRDVLAERGIVFVPISKLNRKGLKRVIKEQKPDIIHAHDMRASFVAARACGNIPFISHVHNNWVDSHSISLKSIAYLYAAKKAKHIFWVSQSSFDGYVFHRFFSRKSSVLYNVIDSHELYEKMEQDKNSYNYDVIYLGRLTYQKNPQHLMKVLQLVVKELPNVKVAIIGTGELEKEVKDLAETYGLLNNVDFLGFQENPLKMLHDSKVLLMTSRWEGTPMCALEAMALGIPIVSTPVDGLKDLVIDGKNGFLSDDDVKLCKTVVSIVLDAKLLDELRKNQLSLANTWNDIKKYKEKIKEQYLFSGN